jgi:hypothetical protein
LQLSGKINGDLEAFLLENSKRRINVISTDFFENSDVVRLAAKLSSADRPGGPERLRIR